MSRSSSGTWTSWGGLSRSSATSCAIRSHACSREAHLLAAAEQPEAEAHDRVAAGGGSHEAVDAELDLAAVEPLPDLIAHLARLEVALQRAVAPAPDARLPAVDGARLVDDVADAHAEVEAQPVEAGSSSMSRWASGRLGS